MADSYLSSVRYKSIRLYFLDLSGFKNLTGLVIMFNLPDSLSRPALNQSSFPLRFLSVYTQSAYPVF